MGDLWEKIVDEELSKGIETDEWPETRILRIPNEILGVFRNAPGFTHQEIQRTILFLEVALRCQSPIEMLLFWAFVHKWCCNVDLNKSPGDCPNIDPEDSICGCHVILRVQEPVICRLEGKALRLTPDFVIYALKDNDCIQFAIELDGHEFHEKTKDQAQRDKVRDRLLVAAGYRVLRFTGSEVWKDPYRIVSEIEDIIRAI